MSSLKTRTMKIVFLLGLFTVILSISCTKSDVDRIFPRIKLEQCVKTPVEGEEVELCFQKLMDSRCPINADCVWSGVGLAELKLTAGTNVATFTLATVDSLPQYRMDTTVFGYKVKLIAVDPYPGSQPGVQPEITVDITK